METILAVLALIAGIFSLVLSAPPQTYVSRIFYITLGAFLVISGIVALL